MLLVIDTALEAQSLAVLDMASGQVIASHHNVIGRGHAEALMPALAELIGGKRPDAIAVDVGPGSFTGLRIGIAAARALGLGWGVEVLGYRSLTLIAAPVFAVNAELHALTVVAEAGRGQLYMQVIARDLTSAGEPVARDAAAIAELADRALCIAGPGAARVAAGTGLIVAADGWPDARHAALLPPACRALPPSPLYLRPLDAVLANAA